MTIEPLASIGTRDLAAQHARQGRPDRQQHSRPAGQLGLAPAVLEIGVEPCLDLLWHGRDRTSKASVRARRKKAAWNDSYMLKLMAG
jgi:hypothetical protein